jgi:hypothetical protein
VLVGVAVVLLLVLLILLVMLLEMAKAGSRRHAAAVGVSIGRLRGSSERVRRVSDGDGAPMRVAKGPRGRRR